MYSAVKPRHEQDIKKWRLTIAWPNNQYSLARWSSTVLVETFDQAMAQALTLRATKRITEPLADIEEIALIPHT